MYFSHGSFVIPYGCLSYCQNMCCYSYPYHFYRQRNYNYHNYAWFLNNPYIPYFSRIYPDVDITIFNQSAIAIKKLLAEATIVINKIADSKQFASKIMDAAQLSNTKEVDHLIKSTGIKSNYKTTFNPDGIHLQFWSNIKEQECCKLDLSIRWR